MQLNRRRLLAMGVGAGIGTASAEEPQPSKEPQWISVDDRLRTDWPYLNRYRAENAALLASGAAVDAVFMGDSITEGWLSKMPAFFVPGRVCRGISGQTTPQMLVRFRQDVIHLRPRIVHIMAGTNDVAGNTGPTTAEMTQDNIRSMAEIARANKVRIILASIPPASHFFWRPEVEPAAAISELNTWIRAYAHDIDAVYADYHGVMSDEHGAMKPGLSYDDVHPSAEGYAVMKPVAEAALAAVSSA